LPKIKVGVKILNNVENVRRLTLKKVSILCLLIFLTVSLTACSGEYLSITEEESDAIAQYCARLLIKYDKNHRDTIHLLDKKDLDDAIKERAEEEAKNNPSPTPTPTPEPSDDQNDQSSETDDGSAVTAEPVPEVLSIAEAGGIEGFAVEYQTHGIMDTYMNDGEYYSFTAPVGKKLCVFEFKIRNTQDTDAKFDAVSYGLGYILYCEGGTSHGSEISLLSDDLQFFGSTIKAGGEAHATLIFYISPEEVPDHLQVTGEKQYNIYLNYSAEVENGN